MVDKMKSKVICKKHKKEAVLVVKSTDLNVKTGEYLCMYGSTSYHKVYSNGDEIEDPLEKEVRELGCVPLSEYAKSSEEDWIFNKTLEKELNESGAAGVYVGPNNDELFVIKPTIDTLLLLMELKPEESVKVNDNLYRFWWD